MAGIAVAGIGNVLMGDDAAGPYIAELLRSSYEFTPEVDILDLGTPGIDLTGYLAPYRAVILIDAVRAEARPGTVVRYEKPELMKDFAAVRLSPHDPSVAQSLCLAELSGKAPETVVLIGVVPEQIGLGDPMTPAVRDAAATAAEFVVRELKTLGVTATNSRHGRTLIGMHDLFSNDQLVNP